MKSAISIKNLKKTYKSGTKALKGISLNIKKGEFHALLGANGAGKTTTIGILTDIVNKTSGTVKIHGIDIDKDFSLAKTKIGVVPQEMNFNIFEKVEDIVIQQAGYYGVPEKIAIQKTHEILKKLSLYDKRNVTSKMLSGGMKRRLMIARALVHDPQVLILDEPTAGVDVELRHDMYKFLIELNKSGVTILLTTHYLEEAESLCDNISIIKSGEVILSGEKNKILKNLNTEYYLIETNKAIDKIKFNFEFKKNSTPLEYTVKINKENPLEKVIAELINQSIKINSIKPKTNRLEQLYLELT